MYNFLITMISVVIISIFGYFFKLTLFEQIIIAYLLWISILLGKIIQKIDNQYCLMLNEAAKF